MRIRMFTYKAAILLCFAASSFISLHGQALTWGDSTQHELKFTGDFRFRIEQDWNSRKSDGTYRTDRTRLRYRLRFGFNYTYDSWATLGMRFRTGDLNDQQDPHVTLGAKGGEFSTLSFGIEKAFFQAKHKWLTAWVGKNTYPFYKHDELFWNDNVFPEGVAIKTHFPFDNDIVNSLQINAGHFIGISRGSGFDKDDYFQGLQVQTSHFNNRVSLPVAIYYFNKVANIPDGQHTGFVKYNILHVAPLIKVLKSPSLSIGFDFYTNMADLADSDGADPALLDETNGYATYVKLGKLKDRGDWAVYLYYVHMERYSAVDYYAQNDWARWDYSGYDAKGSRLTNFKGLEFRVGYMIREKWRLVMRSFFVEQLIPYGTHLENGSRVRLDMDIGF